MTPYYFKKNALRDLLIEKGFEFQDVGGEYLSYRANDRLSIRIGNGMVGVVSGCVEECFYETHTDTTAALSGVMRVADLSAEAAPLQYDDLDDLGCEVSQNLARVMTTRQLIDRYYDRQLDIEQHAGTDRWQERRMIDGAFEDKVFIKKALTIKALGGAE